MHKYVQHLISRLDEDSNGVTVGSIVSNGATNAVKVGDSMGAPIVIFASDTGEKESILIRTPQLMDRLDIDTPFRIHYLCPDVNPFLSCCKNLTRNYW